MQKRGQVTVFVALGVVLVLVLAIAIAFRGDIARIVTQSGAEKQAGFSSQVDSVQKHIEGCLSNALSESILALANEKLDNYDERLADEIILRVGLCLHLESFTDMTVRKLEEPKVEVQRNPDDMVITATMTMPVNIEAEGGKEQLQEFVAQEKLQRKMCVLKEMVDSDCMAKEDLVAGIFVFKQGEEVKIGGDCLAC